MQLSRNPEVLLSLALTGAVALAPFADRVDDYTTDKLAIATDIAEKTVGQTVDRTAPMIGELTTAVAFLPASANTVKVSLGGGCDDGVVKKCPEKKRSCTTNAKGVLETPDWVCERTQNDRELRKEWKVQLFLWSMSPNLAKDSDIWNPKVSLIKECQKTALQYQKEEKKKWFYIINGRNGCSYIPLSRVSRDFRAIYKKGPWAE